MAMSSQIIRKLSLFVFAVMIFQEIPSIDGRPMKPTISHGAYSLKENYQISSAKLMSRKIGAWQMITEKGEVLPQSTLAQSLGPNDSVVVHVDDFRPTEPGNSPGVGHSFTREKDAESKEMDGGDRPVVAAARNDSRPTEPGHSPGVGHSFQHKVTAGPNS